MLAWRDNVGKRFFRAETRKARRKRKIASRERKTVTHSLWTTSHLCAICEKMKEADTSILLAFGLRLRAVRAATQISQEALAELAELDRTYISLLERGRRNPSLVCVASLAQALNVTVSELCDFAGDADK